PEAHRGPRGARHTAARNARARRRTVDRQPQAPTAYVGGKHHAHGTVPPPSALRARTYSRGNRQSVVAAAEIPTFESRNVKWRNPRTMDSARRAQTRMRDYG